MLPRQRFNFLRSLILIGPFVAYMVIEVARSDMEPNELVNAGLVIAAIIIGFIMFFGGGESITQRQNNQTDTQPPTSPPLTYHDSWAEERDRLRLENAALKGQVQAMNVIFQYLDIRVSVKQ